MDTFKIPLTTTPQTFEISLDGTDYIITCKYNDSSEAGWIIDIADALTGDPIVANIPLVTGTDLLAGLEYLGFGGSLIVFTDGDETAVPTFENLGTESNLYFRTDS